MYKFVISFLFAAFLFASCAFAQTPTPTPYSVWPVPQLNANFLTDLQRNLWFEKAAEDGYVFADTVFSGGIHGTAAGKTGTFSAFLGAFIDGRINVDATASIDYDALGASDNDTVWVVACNYGTSPGGNFVQNGTTPYWVDPISATKPAITGSDTPQGTDNNCIYLMKVTISGGAITAVLDLRTQVPVVYALNSTTELTTVPTGFFSIDVDDGRLYYYDGSSWVSIPPGDASGCATCGDSATAFFSTGTLEADVGGTGIDSSAETGVPSISSGTWTVASTLDPSLGGTGIDTSSSTGYYFIDSGTHSVVGSPDWRRTLTAGDIAVDGTNCAKVANEATIVTTGIRGPAWRCADNDASTMSAVIHTPEFDDGTEDYTIGITAVNDSTSSGNIVWELQCVCAGGSNILDAADLPAKENLTITFSGTEGQEIFQSHQMTCGGTCGSETALYIQAEIDASSTTFSGTLETEVSFVYMTVETSTSQLTD